MRTGRATDGVARHNYSHSPSYYSYYIINIITVTIIIIVIISRPARATAARARAFLRPLSLRRSTSCAFRAHTPPLSVPLPLYLYSV